MDALAIGVAGMMSAAGRLDASAIRTASGNTDPATEAVNQTSAKTDFEASAKVVKTAAQTTGALLDMKV